MIRLLIPILMLAATLSATSCSKREKKEPIKELNGKITISGAFALYPLIVKWAEEFQQLHPKIEFDITTGGAGKGITDILTKKVDLGMISHTIEFSQTDENIIYFPVAKDAIVLIINALNPVLPDLIKKGISKQNASKIWVTEEIKTWGEITETTDTNPIRLYTRSDACGAAETFALWIDKQQKDLTGTGVFGDPGMIKAIQKDKLGFGYNNLSYAYNPQNNQPYPGIQILPIDINNDGKITQEEEFYNTRNDIIQAIIDSIYPIPPARELYLISNNIPQRPEVRTFLQYILTEGQKYNISMGYTSLTEEKLEQGLKLLK